MGVRQLRIAESEKFPHVTYFFNGGMPIIYPKEDRISVPSPSVATYDLAARDECDVKSQIFLIQTYQQQPMYDFILLNLWRIQIW